MATHIVGFIWVLESSYVVLSVSLFVPFLANACSVCDVASAVRADDSVWVDTAVVGKVVVLAWMEMDVVIVVCGSV